MRPLDDASDATELFERIHRPVMVYDLAGFAQLFAEDGVMERPFAPPGVPRRLEGRLAIQQVLETAAEQSRLLGRRITHDSNVRVHQTTDPELFIAEFDLHGEVTVTREVYTLPHIQVVQVHAGEIASFRDYMHPTTLSSRAPHGER